MEDEKLYLVVDENRIVHVFRYYSSAILYCIVNKLDHKNILESRLEK